MLFLGYLGLIRLLPELAEGIRPLCPALYHKKMQKICLTTLVGTRSLFSGLFTRVSRQPKKATATMAVASLIRFCVY